MQMPKNDAQRRYINVVTTTCKKEMKRQDIK
jgi:hypothetical protein